MIDSATGRTTTYFYDLLDRMVRYEEKGANYSHSVSYGYDENNNLSEQVEVTNGVKVTTSYTYDDDNRIKTVTTGETVVTYTYDTYGRVSQKVTTAGTPAVPVKTEAFTYTSPAGSTSAQVATYAITYSDRTVTYTYTYDNNGNILSVYDDWGQYTTSYAYDSANQLVRENNEYWGFTHEWDYDSAGNIKNRKEYVYTTGELQNTTATRTVAYGYPAVPTPEENTENSENTEDTEDLVWGDLLTSFNGYGIAYDEIGNPTSGYGWNYTWEHGRQLKAMSGDFEDWTYAYNADGMRTMRTNGTRTYEYVYNGSQLTQMKVDGYTFNFTYDANGTPLTISQGNEVYYYITNLQGDVIALHSVTGGSEALYSYDAWGMCRCDAFSDIEFYNPLRYRGYVYDEETQLYYLQSRYYDPSVGRFLNADGFTSTGQGFSGNNTFVYCGNNPVAFSDYGGNRYCEATTIAGETKDQREFSCAFQNKVSRAKTKAAYGAATSYVPNGSTTTNCLGYVLGVDDDLEPCNNYANDFSLETTVSGTYEVAASLGISIRPLERYNSPISPNEYRIVLKVGEHDYHYMVQHNNGCWSHKPGALPTQTFLGRDPGTVAWDLPDINDALFYFTGEVEIEGVISGYYNSEPRYFAVTK